MAPWGGDYPASCVIEEQNYHARFECRLGPCGSISVTQIGGKTSQDIADEIVGQRARWDRERWGGPFTGYNEQEMGILARLLDREWAEKRLVLTGLLDGVEGGEDEVRQFGERTGRLLTAFEQVSDEKRLDYQRQLEEELIKVRRKRLMEEVFPDDCTLYDVLGRK
jgi:hypothetical protein